ncbi:MAG: hypothetical protein ING44_04800 [Telmatospirillum sp.]|nr:hypothetical protein [Telmatospirillum sp.]
MSQIAADLAAQTIAPLVPARMPAVLTASILQHERNLTTLATALLNDGCDESTVAASLATMFESYRKQLTAVLVRLKEDADAGGI